MGKYRYARKKQHKQPARLNLYLLLAGITLVLVAAVVIISQNSTTNTAASSETAVLAPNQPAPAFTGTSLDNGSLALSDYAGDVVLVNFWATWCPPCKAEMPDINAYYEAHRDDGFTVLAVNAQESESLVRPFIETAGFTFPVLLDPAGQINNQYQVRSYPTTIIIDRSGTVRHIQVGIITPQQMESIITPLIEG